MRALGLDLPGLSAKHIEKRPYPPGQHGQKRRKPSEYARRLKEKQKLRFNYGLGEKQLRNVVLAAQSSKTATGAKIIELLERRLDNVVFRAGLARTIPAARQLVTHGHVQVNGKRVDIPSYRVDQGQTIALAGKIKTALPADAAGSGHMLEVPRWLEVDRSNASARVASLPDGESAPFSIDTRLVVEFYAQSL